MVLVGEHLDESLVLLRRKMCWQLEDVVHFSLKVSRRPSSPMLPEHVDEIMKFNAVDARLYEHFNASLWRAIAAAPGLAEEIAALQGLREHMVNECDAVRMNNRRGRKYLLSQPANSLQSRCARLTMDSIEFSRFFKLAQGAAYNECIRGTASYLALVKPRFAGVMGDALTNILYRHAVSRREPVGVPVLGLGEHTTAYTIHSMDGQAAATWIADGTPLFSEEQLSRLIDGRHARFITVVPDPVERFLDAWAAYDMDAELAKVGHRAGMAAALTSNRQSVRDLLEPIRNTFSKDFNASAPNDITKTGDTSKVLRSPSFSFVLPSTAGEVGLAYLSRLLCWDPSEFVHVHAALDQAGSRRAALPGGVVKAIEKFNRVDVRLFQTFERNFRAHVESEYQFEPEVDRFRALLAVRRRDCAHLASRAKTELLHVAQSTAAADQRSCALLYMDPPMFAQLIAATYAAKTRRELAP